jgi:hypothetical protein
LYLYFLSAKRPLYAESKILTRRSVSCIYMHTSLRIVLKSISILVVVPSSYYLSYEKDFSDYLHQERYEPGKSSRKH